MISTTDGKQFVYGVFTADGYECEFLDSIHGSEDSAQKRLTDLKSTARYCYGDAALAHIKVLEVKGEASR